MEILETSVRLVVKAPNQQIDDQVVECTLGWTVQKLKAYLSEAYPSKPKTEEQKLIYSGQLLHDHLTLKDFLRQYETERVHTVHLVCVPSKETYVRPKPEINRNEAGNRSDSGTRTSEANVASPSSNQSDGLRQRLGNSMNVPRHPNFVTPNPMPTMPNFMMNYQMPTFSNPTDQIAFQQMVWMQQVYGQYMNHYFQRYQCPPEVASETSRETTSANSMTAQNQIPINPEAVPVNAGAERQPAANNNNNDNVRMNAQGGPVDDDDEEAGRNWDWLDWAYVLSRAAVLLSIVYFYSSLGRFVTVTFVTIFMYLYQMGWLNARRQRRRPVPPPPPVPVQRNQQQDERPAEEPLTEQADENGAEGVTENIPDEEMQRETREIEELMNRGLDDTIDEPRLTSLANFIWTVVTTFFSSLLPETPAPANLN